MLRAKNKTAPAHYPDILKEQAHYRAGDAALPFPPPPCLTDVIYCGDCASVLARLPSGSLDAVITSPPYFQQREYTGIGIGQEKTPESYIESLMECFAELVRVIKPTGSILYNLGDKIDKRKGTRLMPYRFAIAALDAIDELSLLNDITWVKKNPVPRQFQRRLVSSTEPFFHFVKSNEYFYDVDNFMTPERSKVTRQVTDKLGGRYFRLIKDSDLTPDEKAHANKRIRETVAEVMNGEIEGFRVKIRGIHAPAFGGGDGGRKSQIERNGFTIIKLLGKPMKKDCVNFSVETGKGLDHPAVFPLAMIEELIKLACPAGGVVLDPYCGSGTTLLAAKNQGRHYIGIDISPKYCDIAKTRLKKSNI